MLAESSNLKFIPWSGRDDGRSSEVDESHAAKASDNTNCGLRPERKSWIRVEITAEGKTKMSRSAGRSSLTTQPYAVVRPRAGGIQKSSARKFVFSSS